MQLRKQKRELVARAEQPELDVVRKIDPERGKIREAAQKQFQEEHELAKAEKDRKITELGRQLEEMKRQMEQGSQKGQG